MPYPTAPRCGVAVAAAALVVALVGAPVPVPASGSVDRCGSPLTLRCLGSQVDVWIGDSYDPGESAAETRLRLKEFDAVTLPNFTWSATEPEPGKFDFAATDREIAFAKRNHLYVTANHFIWDQIAYQSTPPWVNSIDNAAELRRVMFDHLAAFTRRYGDAIKAWTVVNEPLEYFPDPTAIQPNHFAKVLGPDWIADAFDIAHRAAPHASLWLNEVFTEDEPTKAQALVALVTTLVDDHVPIDGVALEGHLFSPGLQPVSPDLALVHQTLEQLSALGLQVALSEMDRAHAAVDPRPPSGPGYRGRRPGVVVPRSPALCEHHLLGHR